MEDKIPFNITRDNGGEEYDEIKLTVKIAHHKEEIGGDWDEKILAYIEILEVVDENGKTFELTEKEKEGFYEEFWRNVE